MTNDTGVYLLPKKIEVARKLAGTRAKAMLYAYETTRKRYNEKAQQTLGVYSLSESGELVGSNTFARCLLDTLSPKGTRLANLVDLLHLSDINPKLLEGTYEDDNSVVLRSLKDNSNLYNNYLIKVLAKKLKIRNIKKPLLITNLGVKDNEESGYGLVLVPTSATNVIEALQLSNKNHERKFTFYDKNGMPIFNDETDKNGKRKVWNKDSGLSVLCLNRNNELTSRDGYLAGSGVTGRVVEISDEVTANNFLSDYQKKLQANHEAQKNELLERFEKASKLLRGEN